MWKRCCFTSCLNQVKTGRLCKHNLLLLGKTFLQNNRKHSCKNRNELLKSFNHIITSTDLLKKIWEIFTKKNELQDPVGGLSAVVCLLVFFLTFYAATAIIKLLCMLSVEHLLQSGGSYYINEGLGVSLVSYLHIQIRKSLKMKSISRSIKESPFEIIFSKKVYHTYNIQIEYWEKYYCLNCLLFCLVCLFPEICLLSLPD